jgi:ubiquitin-like 1-activating enzyme E1 B
MSDMWKSRTPPVPLDFAGIQAGSFVLRGVSASTAPNGSASSAPKGSTATEAVVRGSVAALTITNGKTNGSTSAPDAAKLRDQRLLSLSETLEQFVRATGALAARLRDSEPTIAFDKDDPDALDFVTAGANLRAAAYGLPQKSRWEVKGARPR